MKEPTKRNYRATFILDNRGKQDFARVTDRKMTSGSYVHVTFSAPPDAPTHLRERLRLNSSVYRTFVQEL
jgi:small subunit ribosomal protein S6